VGDLKNSSANRGIPWLMKGAREGSRDCRSKKHPVHGDLKESGDRKGTIAKWQRGSAHNGRTLREKIPKNYSPPKDYREDAERRWARLLVRREE